MAKAAKSGKTGAGDLGYEAQLWQMADALRGSMDAAEYKHVCLGLLFLKYISDAFEEKHAALLAEKAQGADPEDPDEYRAQSIFWVPPEARWPYLKAHARQPTIGQLVDGAMEGIERDNPTLKGVLPNDYSRPALDRQRLGQLIDMISNIKVGDKESQAKDMLGRVYDSRCRSGSMFAQSEKFIGVHAANLRHVPIYGQLSNYSAWRFAMIDLALQGVETDFYPERIDTFRGDLHPDLRAECRLVAKSYKDVHAWLNKGYDGAPTEECPNTIPLPCAF